MRFLLLILCAMPLVAQAPRDLTGHWILPGSADTGVAPPDTTLPPPSVPARRGPAAQIRLLLGMAGAVPAFQLVQSDTAIVVTNRDGFRYVLHPGGDEDRLTVLETVDVRYRARWDGTQLEVEWRPDGGGRIRERYQLADSGLYLRVDVTVEYERFRQSDSRLYRRSAPETN